MLSNFWLLLLLYPLGSVAHSSLSAPSPGMDPLEQHLLLRNKESTFYCNKRLKTNYSIIAAAALGAAALIRCLKVDLCECLNE